MKRHLCTSAPRIVNTPLKAIDVSGTGGPPNPHPHRLNPVQCPTWEKTQDPCFLDPAPSLDDTLSGLSKTHVLLHEKEKLWLNCLNYEGSVQQFPRAFELRFFYGFIILSFGSLSEFFSQCRSVMDCHSKMFLWQGDFLPELGVNYEVGNLGASRRLSYFIFIYSTLYSQSPFSTSSHFTLPNA